MAFNETMRRAFRPAHENGLTASERHVLLELCNGANRFGRLFPAHETIARNVGCSRATVIRAMARLEALGWVTKERRRRRDGTRSSDMLRVAAPTVAKAPDRILPLMAVVSSTDVDKVAPCNSVKVAPCDTGPGQQSRTMQQQTPIKDSNLDPATRRSAISPVANSPEEAERIAAGLRDLVGQLGGRRRAG